MENKQRKEGWYWVVVKVNAKYKPIYFNGFLWEVGNFRVNDSRFYHINETKIIMPEEPNILDKAITLIKQDIQLSAFSNQVYGKQLLSIIEKLKIEQ